LLIVSKIPPKKTSRATQSAIAGHMRPANTCVQSAQ